MSIELTGDATTEEPTRDDEAATGDDPGDRKPAAEITARDACERLRRGEPISNARIVGLHLRGDFDLPIKLSRVELIKPRFEKARFAGCVELDRCKLIRPVFGKKAVFAQGLDLRGCLLVAAMFRETTVAGKALRCDGMRTLGTFTAVACRFESEVRFWDARFDGWAEFTKCHFLASADFRSLHAEQGFKLLECQFAGDALFRGASFPKRWDAEKSRFEGLLDLSRAKFHDFAYLEAIEQGPGHRIAFHNALAERILIRPEQVEGRLASEQAGEYETAMHEYGLLKKNYENLHRYEQEDWAFYRFKVNQRRCCQRSWRRPWSKCSQGADFLFLDHGCGYGTNPARAVRAALLIIAAFAVIYMIGVEGLNVEKPPFGDDPKTLPNRVMIGLLTSVSVFTSGFGSLKDAARGWINLPLIAESLLGTLLWGLFIVAFSRKVIR
ncbi:hypothetical protein TA3x_000997 [Tundrisphaera sp. TA3]|uniref:hypothetical protein n=1 Tax=Tundrisphaera sp. TA3 TaxID=3435775 RepID=UPI003EBF08AB